MMKSILLIGLGRFGRHIAMKLDELNHQVMAIDRNEERVDAILPYVTNAQIGDATKEGFMESLGVRNFDVCIVAIGDDFQSSLEATSLLSELGAKYVVSRAARDVHAKLLLKNGADEVIYPESRWLNGQRSVTVQTTFWTMWSLMMNMLFLKFLFRKTGWEELLDSLTSETSTTLISWHLNIWES